jgi:hypothetical protein
MACAHCPYKMNYELLWTDARDSDVICVMLRCCAGPELQVRRASTSEVLLDEIFPSPDDVRARARQLLDEGFDPGVAAPHSL